MLPGDRSGDWSWCIIWWPPLHWFLHPRFLPIPHDLSNAWLSPAQEICEKHHPRHDFAAEGYQHIDVPKEGKITVCGDIHGQFYDLLKIFYLNNLPSEQNPYVFNGDFVDRGHFSTEVVLTLFAWKLALPNHIHLNRGNHETAQINGFYGFKQEVVDKYGENLYDLFCEAFRLLPLCHLINGAVFVVHGGLFSKDDVTLKDIRKLNRYCEPKGIQGSEALICDMLWSDPQHCQGRAPSKRGGRGVGIAFGPDVTERFLLKNSLKMIIRSHEKNGKAMR